MLRWMFLAITVVVGIPALAANWYINTVYTAKVQGTRPALLDSDQDSGDTDIDLLIFTAANAGGNAMSAHVIFECLTTCLVILFGTSFGSSRGPTELISHSMEPHVGISTSASDLVPNVIHRFRDHRSN